MRNPVFNAYLCLASYKRNIGEQCEPRWDATYRGLIRVFTVNSKYKNSYKKNF